MGMGMMDRIPGTSDADRVTGILRANCGTDPGLLVEYMIIARTLESDGKLHQHTLPPREQSYDTCIDLLAREMAHLTAEPEW